CRQARPADCAEGRIEGASGEIGNKEASGGHRQRSRRIGAREAGKIIQGEQRCSAGQACNVEMTRAQAPAPPAKEAGKGTKDEEHAMSDKFNSEIAVINPAVQRPRTAEI